MMSDMLHDGAVLGLLLAVRGRITAAAAGLHVAVCLAVCLGHASQGQPVCEKLGALGSCVGTRIKVDAHRLDGCGLAFSQVERSGE